MINYVISPLWVLERDISTCDSQFNEAFIYFNAILSIHPLFYVHFFNTFVATLTVNGIWGGFHPPCCKIFSCKKIGILYAYDF